MAVDMLTTEEGKQLLTLCRSGKLYEIEAWIPAGRSLHVPAGLRKSPLQVAIDLGFHSLVELLAKHEDCQAIKDGALSDAVELRRLELVELLLSLGAGARGIPFSTVLLAWNPAVIRLFLRKGADVVTGARSRLRSGPRSARLYDHSLNTKQDIRSLPRRCSCRSIPLFATSAVRAI
jgi:hypothetical protein